MNLIEAIKSRKPFRRPCWGNKDYWESGHIESDGKYIGIEIEDIIATDYIVEDKRMNNEITTTEAEITEKIIWKILEGMPQETKTFIKMNVLESLGWIKNHQR